MKLLMNKIKNIFMMKKIDEKIDFKDAMYSSNLINYIKELIENKIENKIEIKNIEIEKLLNEVRETRNEIDAKLLKYSKKQNSLVKKTIILKDNLKNKYENLKINEEKFNIELKKLEAKRSKKLKELKLNHKYLKKSMLAHLDTLVVKNKKLIKKVEVNKDKDILLRNINKFKNKKWFINLKSNSDNNKIKSKQIIENCLAGWTINLKKFKDKQNEIWNLQKKRVISMKKAVKQVNKISKKANLNKKVIEKKAKEPKIMYYLLIKFLFSIRFLFSKESLIMIIKKSLLLIWEYKIILFIMLFSIFVNALYPRFLTMDNILGNVLMSNITIGFISIGMTLVILTGGIDLSVGSLMAYTSTMTISVYLTSGSLLLGILVGLSIGIAYGIFAGFLISKIKLQPFIVTLIGMLIFRGLTYMKLNGSPITLKNSEFFDFLGYEKWGIFPAILVIFFIISIFLIFIMSKSRYGRRIYATGGNEDAARMSGIKTKWIITSTYIILGVLVVLGGFTFIGRLKTATPTAGAGYELDAIAAVVLGGTSLIGGKGGIGRTLIGWFTISLLANAMIFLRIEPNTQLLVKGIVILVAILFDKNIDINGKLRFMYIKMSIYISFKNKKYIKNK